MNHGRVGDGEVTILVIILVAIYCRYTYVIMSQYLSLALPLIPFLLRAGRD